MAASNFDTTRVRLGDLVAAGSGALLFLSLFLPWYNASVQSALVGSIGGSVSGWEALSFIDILLFVVALVAIGVAVARMANVFPRMSVSPGLLVLGAGAIAAALVLFRLLVLPGDLSNLGNLPGVDVGRSVGIFIALLAALGVAAGGWITWNEEGRPRPSTGAARGYAQQQPPASAPVAAPPPASAPVAAPPAAAPQQQPAPPPAGGAADWYPDPQGEKRLRYWDGSQWTHHVAD